MVKNKGKLIEIFKSLIIFLLLALLAFNLYLVFMQKAKRNNAVEYSDDIHFEYKTYLQPYKIRFTEGKQTYFIYDDLDKKLCDKLRDYLIDVLSNSYELEKIDDISAKRGGFSMLAMFYPSAFDIDLFIASEKRNEGEKVGISTIKDVYFLAADKMEIVIYTGSDYYKIKSKDEKNIKSKVPLSKFKERIKEILSSTSLRYQDVDYILNRNDSSEKMNSPVFLCRGYYAPPIYKSKAEYDFSDSLVCSKMLNKIFEAKSPFVKEAENSEGDKVYLSEHGTDILKLSQSGKIDYQIKTDSTKQITSLQKDFMTALKFENKVSPSSSGIRLDSFKEVDKKAYFQRIFYFRRNDGIGRVYSNAEMNGVKIVIDGGRLVEYTRYLPFYEKDVEGSNLESGVTYDDRTILDIIAKKENYTELRKMYLECENVDVTKDVTVNAIINKVDSIDLAYYRDGKANIRPCYKVNIGRTYFLIDFYTGEGVFYELVEG